MAEGGFQEAILPQTTSGEHRTGVFAAYNLVASLSGAFGSLAAGLPAGLGLGPPTSYRVLIWRYMVAALVLLALYTALSTGVEVQTDEHADDQQWTNTAAANHAWFGVHRSRGVVAKLAALFALDSFASGCVVQGLVAYWFHLQYGVNTSGLGQIFFGANLLSAFSVLAAPLIAKRIGLLKTMVFTHLPGNILLLLVPLMPDLELAVTVFLARYLFAQLDRPARQSYMMAIVDPDERSGAAGIFSVARTAAQGVAPVVAGAMLVLPGLGLPFLIAGGLKIVYDLTILMLFRNVQPPEGAA